jgi:hypothetical protein
MSYEWDDLCVDCRTNVTPNTPPGSQDWCWFMVRNHIWQAAGFTKFGDGCICLDCLEKRLGRELTAADLLPCPLNDPDDYAGRDIPRLAELKRELVEMYPDDDWARNRPVVPVPLKWRIVLMMPRPLRNLIVRNFA